DVEDRGRPGGTSPPDRETAGRARRVAMILVLARGVELEPGRGDAAASRLDAEHEFRVDERLAMVVQLHRVDLVALGIVHPRRDERIVEAVGVEVANARSPRTVAFG